MAITHKLAILTPLFQDWKSFWYLMHDLDQGFLNSSLQVHVIAIDDGSSEPMPVPSFAPQHIHKLNVIRLVRNLGHQRAIAVGLAYVQQHESFDLIVVMDGDGEDRPSDVLRLLSEHERTPQQIIAAARGRRSEHTLFRLGYGCYKTLFRLLVGRDIDFGNFCLIPAQCLTSLVYQPSLWNHFAATLGKSQLPLKRVTLDRGKRYEGQSRMNLESLLLHGLSAISVYADVVFLRLVMFCAWVGAAALLGIGIVVAILLFTDLAIPGWATSAIGILTIIMLQMLILSVSTLFFHLNLRSQDFTSPAIEGLRLIDTVEVLYDCKVHHESV